MKDYYVGVWDDLIQTNKHTSNSHSSSTVKDSSVARRSSILFGSFGFIGFCAHLWSYKRCMEETVRNETLAIKIIQALLKEYRTPCHLFHPAHLAHLIIKRMSVIFLLNVLSFRWFRCLSFIKILNLLSISGFGRRSSSFCQLVDISTKLHLINLVIYDAGSEQYK